MASQWKKMSFFAFRLTNRPGELARFLRHVKGAGINLLGLWGYAPGIDEPTVSCVPESADAFRGLATSDQWPAGGHVEEGITYYLCEKDEPGALARELARIAEHDINVESIECIAAGDQFGCFIWTATSQREALEKVLFG